MKKILFVLVLVFVSLGSVFAKSIALDTFEVGFFDKVTNTYYMRNIEVFYDDETDSYGFWYFRDQTNKIKYTYTFANSADLNSLIIKLQNCLDIINGKLTVASLNSKLDVSSPNDSEYNFTSSVNLYRDEVISVGDVSTIYRTHSTFALSFFIKSGWRNICIGGNRIVFNDTNKKYAIEVFGLNAEMLNRLINMLKNKSINFPISDSYNVDIYWFIFRYLF